MEILENLGRLGIIPVARFNPIEQAGRATDLVKAVIKVGLPCTEITFRTETAKKAVNIVQQIRQCGGKS